jgi:hypothetical protein
MGSNGMIIVKGELGSRVEESGHNLSKILY